MGNKKVQSIAVTQKLMRLDLPRQDSRPKYLQDMEVRILNEHVQHPERFSPRKQDQFAALLKRQAREIMCHVTTCPAVQLPGAIARLDDWLAVADAAIANRFVDTDECIRSDRALLYALTLADFVAAVELTRRDNRAPSFVTPDKEFRDGVNRRLDLIFAFLTGNLPRTEEHQ